MKKYDHIIISEEDSAELADMKMAYLIAARERDMLLEALKDAATSLSNVGAHVPAERAFDIFYRCDQPC